MISEKCLRQYAELAVRLGVHVQKGQLLVIKAQVDSAPFVRLCVEEGYRAGAGEVVVLWQDDQLTKLDYDYADTAVLQRVPDWLVAREQEFVDRGYCILNIDSSIPGIMKDVDQQKVQQVVAARRKALEKFQNYTMANEGQWSIIAIPNPEWALKVFPDETPEAAVEKLWNAILASVRIQKDQDPIALWEKHNQELSAHNDWLNRQQFASLHFKNQKGTDLVVELAEGHIWEGGCEKSQHGVVFNPNMPTEENFTMPKRTGVQGRVQATKPLSYQGKLIQNFWIEFEQGKAVRWHAEEEEAALASLIEFDEGSAYLGGVGLIDADTPISQSGILFYNTLFDENASCHLALGRAYPMNMEGSQDMSEEEMKAKGCNFSMVHVDFMFGSDDMQITGVHADKTEVVFFKDGKFCIEA